MRQEIERPELLHLMLEHDYALTALIAPAGYGKTTLLAQCARHEPGRALWLSLREDDADPVRLCERLAGVIRDVLPTLALTSLERAGHAAHDLALAYALADDLNRSTTNLDFFLDGLELLHPTSGQWLERLIGTLTEGHRFFLAGRTEAGLGLAHLTASGLGQVLGPAQLAFTVGETGTRLHRLGTPPAETEQLHARLEGWPLGISLVANGARAPEASARLGPESLLEEVIERLPEPLRFALPEASVLDIWNEAEAAKQHLALPEGWLRDLRRAGLPLSPLGGAYRPHQLLRELLERELQSRPTRYRELYLAAGQRAEQEGNDWLASERYRQAGDLPSLLRVAERLALTYESRSEHLLVRQVLEHIPGADLPPYLQVLLARALIQTGESARGEQWLRQLHAAGERSAALFISLAIQAARAGKPDEQLALIAEGLKQTPTVKEQLRLLRLKVAALLEKGQPALAISIGLEALEEARVRQFKLDIAEVLFGLSLAYKDAGDFPACEAAIRSAIQIFREINFPARWLESSNDLADLLRQQGQFHEALKILKPALPEAKREKSIVYPLLLETFGDVLRELGQFPEAGEYYEQSLQEYRPFKEERLMARLFPRIVTVWLLCGERLKAEQTVALIPLLIHADSTNAVAARRFCEGVLAEASGEWPVATASFLAVNSGQFNARQTLGYRAALHAAYCALRGEQFDGGQASDLDQFLTGVTSESFYGIDEPKILAVKEACEQAGWPAHALQRLLGARATVSETFQDKVKLSLTTLGSLRVRVEDQAIHIPLSRSGEVLVWLALHGESTRDTMVDALWEGSREARHIEYFKVAVRHLRLALAADQRVNFNPIPFENGRYRLASQFEIHLDLQVIREALADPTPRRLGEAVEAYSGPFLPLCETEWAQEIRMNVLEQTLSCGLTLAAMQQQTPLAAAATLERCIELDPLHEASHEQLIHLWLAHRQREAVRRTFNRYQNMLQNEWGRAPEPDLCLRVQSL